MQKSADVIGLDYWLRWQVPVCAAFIVVPTAVAVVITKRMDRPPMKPTDLWVPCWRNLNPIWLLIYRAFAFASMASLLYLTVASFGPFVFYFYTQWTFALVVIYFALATIISANGCWKYWKKPFLQNGDREKLVKKDSEGQIDHQLGLCENIMQNVYQTCAGAVMLTDIVFWCILLPFMTGENFKLTLLIGCMHSVNAVFLLLDSTFNSLPFPWYGFVYFVLWSFSYVTFHWILHACGSTWWPYPFLELLTPWAPLWYFGLMLVHVPCYGLYGLLVKAKNSIFSRMFPHAFLRVSDLDDEDSMKKKD